MSKTRVLAWGDYASATGFATVMRNIMGYLHATGNYDIDIIGINYDGCPYDMEKWPGRVWPAISALRNQGPYADLFGRQVFLDRLQHDNYDVVFIVQDTYVVLPIAQQIKQLQELPGKNFKTIFYFPFDCEPPTEWITQCVDLFDYPVAYTEYAKNEVRKVIGKNAERYDVIYHGTNTNDFFLVPEKKVVKKEVFGAYADRFIITNVNRNQGRKDIGRSFLVLKELRRRGYTDPVLYLHMQETDFGGSVLEQGKSLGLFPEKDFTIPNPQQFGAHQGFPVEVLNKIYNGSDVYLTTTHGEGWGLTITEAMSTKLPVIAPNNTAITEILGDDRGWLVDSGANPSMWVLKDNDNNRVRPLMDVVYAADIIEAIITNPEVTKDKVENAYNWIQQNTWDIINKQWEAIFKKAANQAKSSALI